MAKAGERDPYEGLTDAVRDMLAYERDHPIDHGPMHEAVARGDIDAAVEQAMLLGLAWGRLSGLYGIDAVKWRAFSKSMANMRARRGPSGARHADWQAHAEKFWEENRDRTAGHVAKLVRTQLLAEQQKTGELERIPTAKTIQNKIRKPG